jgi:hypothetical protein
MLLIHIALTPESPGTVEIGELARVAAAIQRQVSRDFEPFWEVEATVDAFPTLEQVPLGYWPVVVTARELGDDEGFHLTSSGEPFSLVEILPGWSVTASHEILEMLVDPYGNRTIPGPAPSGDIARVEYLLEICDPCQSAACAYTVNDVLVSDFVTPAFFAPVGPHGSGNSAAYSFGGNINAPRSVAPGGSLTFLDRARGTVVHMTRDEGQQGALLTVDGAPNERVALRAGTSAFVKSRRKSMRMRGIDHAIKATRKQEAADVAMEKRALALRKELSKLGQADRRRLREPTNEEVSAKIDAALNAGQELDSTIVALLQQAKKELAAPLPATRPSQEQMALNLVQSALREPAGPDVLTARDVPGIGQFDHEDIRWAKALIEYVAHRKTPFPVCPVESEPQLVHPISDTATIAIAGDWGTHNAASQNIGKAIRSLVPGYTIHLGDVYYAGMEDEENQFVTDWPAGTAGSFTLNSNHEMYSGGYPYFGMALRSQKFNYQTYSYFALSSSHWLFLGLDSAYNATRSGVAPYDVGHLPVNDPQVAWLRRLLASEAAKMADGSPKRVCLLTHHQALDVFGAQTGLLGDVTTALGRAPDLWYWGHIHGAAVYNPRALGGVQFYGRLLGHGGIPYISDFDPVKDGTSGIEWAERSPNNAVGANGFAVLRLSGATIYEEFFDETGALQYQRTLS